MLMAVEAASRLSLCHGSLDLGASQREAAPMAGAALQEAVGVEQRRRLEGATPWW
jgi:hypothetical protein